MSVYFYEGAQILAPLSIISNEPMFDIDSVSLKKQRASQGAQRWELAFGVIGEPDTQVDLFLSAAVGIETATTMIMPQLNKVNDRSTLDSTSTTLFGSTVAGSSIVNVDASATTGLLPKGSFIKFSNHDKLYVVTADANFTTGSTAVSIYPTLKTTVAAADFMRTDAECTLTYLRSIDSATGITFTDGVLSSIGTVELIEVV